MPRRVSIETSASFHNYEAQVYLGRRIPPRLSSATRAGVRTVSPPRWAYAYARTHCLSPPFLNELKSFPFLLSSDGFATLRVRRSILPVVPILSVGGCRDTMQIHTWHISYMDNGAMTFFHLTLLVIYLSIDDVLSIYILLLL